MANYFGGAKNTLQNRMVNVYWGLTAFNRQKKVQTIILRCMKMMCIKKTERNLFKQQNCLTGDPINLVRVCRFVFHNTVSHDYGTVFLSWTLSQDLTELWLLESGLWLRTRKLVTLIVSTCPNFKWQDHDLVRLTWGNFLETVWKILCDSYSLSPTVAAQ